MYDNMLSEDAKDGPAINVSKYSKQDDSNFRAKDIKRIENTAVHLTKLQNKISKCKAEITKQKKPIFQHRSCHETLEGK